MRKKRSRKWADIVHISLIFIILMTFAGYETIRKEKKFQKESSFLTILFKASPVCSFQKPLR